MELKDLDIEEVSLVKRPANKKAFIMWKSLDKDARDRAAVEAEAKRKADENAAAAQAAQTAAGAKLDVEAVKAAVMQAAEAVSALMGLLAGVGESGMVADEAAVQESAGYAKAIPDADVAKAANVIAGRLATIKIAVENMVKAQKSDREARELADAVAAMRASVATIPTVESLVAAMKSVIVEELREASKA